MLYRPFALLAMAGLAAAQTPPDAPQTLTLGQVTITTYNPVTVTGLENSSNVYFVLKNQSTGTRTVQLTSWQEMVGMLPPWLLQFFKFDYGSNGPNDTTDFALQAGESRTVKFYLSDEVNYGPAQQVDFPFRFKVAETGDQGTMTVRYRCDDQIAIDWSTGDQSHHPQANAVIAGKVTNAAGAPIRGAEITAMRWNERTPVRAYTGSDGSFRLEVFSLDQVRSFLGPRPLAYHDLNYWLTAEAEGYLVAYRDGIAPAAGQTVAVDLTLKAGDGVRTDSPQSEPLAQTPMYQLAGEIATDGLLSYWQLRFAGPNNDRVIAVIGQHAPDDGETGHIIAVDLTAKELWRIPTPRECWGFHVSNDGTMAAAGCHDGYLYIVAAADGRIIQKVKIGSRPGGGWVEAVRFSPDGKYVMSDGAAPNDGFSKVEVATGKATQFTKETFLYNGRWSPDGTRFAGGSQGYMGMWLADGTQVWHREMGESPLFIEMDANYNVYAAGKSRELFSWDKDGNLRWSYRLSTTANEAAHGLPADGSFILSPNMNGHLQMFNPQGQVQWQRFTEGLFPKQGLLPSCALGTGHNALSITPDGNLIAIGDRCQGAQVYGRDGTLLWRHRSTLRNDFKGDDPVTHGVYPGVNTIDITPDGKYIAAGYADAVIRIFKRDDAAATRPRILSVQSAGGGSAIAQNTWIEIKGANLAPADVPAGGMTWSNAPEFAQGRMPTQLGGVSVKVNGKPAYVYYVSAGQINVLTPLDGTTGSVPLQVTIGGASTTLNVTYQSLAPWFLRVGATSYVLATHADGAFVGPASMSAPGYPFRPAKPGETIVLYAVGLGLPATAIVDGAASQSGALASRPGIDLGNFGATVTFAGLISPGLYQLNVVVPVSAPDGDNSVQISLPNQPRLSTDAVIAVQH
jgi:uncharacterized protein (TIGR03437 family)